LASLSSLSASLAFLALSSLACCFASGFGLFSGFGASPPAAASR
jgi:hypothetical protein